MKPLKIILLIITLTLCYGCAKNITIKNAKKAGARQLSGLQLVNLLPDNTLHMTTWDKSFQADVSCRKSGALTAVNGQGEASDGKWNIAQGDKLCLQFTAWGNGDRVCYEIFQNNDLFQAFRGDGGLEYTITLARPLRMETAHDNRAAEKKAAQASTPPQEKSWWEILTRKKQHEKAETPAQTLPLIVEAGKPSESTADEEGHWWDILTFKRHDPELYANGAEKTPLTETQKQLYASNSCPSCNLTGLDLRRAELKKANLTGADLTGANLEGAELAKANLSGANLTGANLAEANLLGANLAGADLSRANLHWAILTKADLTGARLKGAYLVKAECFKADFTHADLTDAVLQRANLDQAIGIEKIEESDATTAEKDEKTQKKKKRFIFF